MLIGYARVSTADQAPAHQIDALRRAGVDTDRIYLDTASGAKASRPKWNLVRTLLRRGDTLVITRLDRLGRSMLHLVTLGAELREEGIGLKVLEQGMDTDTAEGRAMFGMLSVLAEFQRELIVANTRDGLAAARARGRTGGRRPKLTPAQVRQAQRLYDEGEHTVEQIAGMFGVKRATLYGHLDKTTVGARPRATKNSATKNGTPTVAVATAPAPATATTAPEIPRPMRERITGPGSQPDPELMRRLERQRLSPQLAARPAATNPSRPATGGGNVRISPSPGSMTTVLNTADLPLAERSAAWVEATGLALVSTHIRFHEPERVTARIQTMALGPVQLSAMSYSPLSSQRTHRLIRQSDPELYQLGLITGGRQSIEQARLHVPLAAGDLVLYDSSRSFRATVEPHPEGAQSAVLQFPRSLLPLPEAAAARLCATPLSGRVGVGRLLSQLLAGLVETHTDVTPADAIRLGNTAIDLTAALLAHHIDRQALLPPESRQRALFEQISAFITAHLHDPDLKPGTVAAAHFISTRYLHRIFQQHGTTVRDFVRQQRLARCRRDLANPSGRTVPVGAIGRRWGYTRPSDFTRAFRAAVGMTPSEYRAAMESFGNGS